MSSIIIAKDIPADAPKWVPGANVARHNLTSENTVDPRRMLPGFNRYGNPEGIFTYGKDATVAQDFVVDIDIAPKHDKLTGQTGVQILGVHLMCPRCLQALYIRTADSPSGVGRPAHEIEVHWSRRKAAKDGYWRPVFSVGGPIRCENMWKTSTRATPDTLGLCNWRGGILMGRCFDHTV